MRFSLTSSLIRLFLLRSIKYPRRLCSQTDDTSTYHQNPNLDDTSNYRQNPGAKNRNYKDFQQIPNGLIGMVQGVVGNNIFPTQMIHSRMVITSQIGKESTEASESSQNIGILEKLDGFIKEGKVKKAMEVLGVLEKQCIPVDLPRLLKLMQACGEAKGLEEAKAMHEHIVRAANPLNVITYNKILKTYSQCGSMDDAFNVFNNMEQHNLTSWDTMITGLAKNGLGEDVVNCFSRFKRTGLKPDGQIFIGVFFACSVLGDCDEGMLHFESMINDYRIIPSMKHYVSIVNMLGSTGYLDEALQFIEKMPMEASVDVWETLMNVCRIHGNLELGDRCAELVEQLDPSRLNEKTKLGLVLVKASDIVKDKKKKGEKVP